MPTAGRLIAGLCFAILGFVIAIMTVPLWEEGRSPQYWFPLCVLAGIWSGWTLVGPKTGRGFGSSVGLSLTAVASQAFWILFMISGYDMIRKAMRKSYDGPVDAVINIFEIGGKYALQFATVDVIIALVAGGIISGLFTEFFARLYPN